MEKIWLKSYPLDVAAEINPDIYESLTQLLLEALQKYSDAPAFYNLGTTLTFRQIDEYSAKFAAYLQQTLKLKKGDRFGIMLPNILQYPVVMLGALRAGLIIVNINPMYTPPELLHQLQDSGTETIIVLANFLHTVEKVLPNVLLKNVVVTYMGDLLNSPKGWLVDFVLKYIKKVIPKCNIPNAIYFKEILINSKNLQLQPVKLIGQDIAFLQYTGGTTGVAKGAMLTHRNLIANVLQAEAWFKPLFKPGHEIVITALPLYHIFSLMANCLFIFKVGGYNILITDPRNIKAMVNELKKFKFSVITGVNTLFNALVKNSDFAKLDFSRLIISLGGGASVQRAVAEKWQEVTKVPLLEAYGLTETSPCVAVNPVNLKSYNGTVGLPVSSTDVCIFDDDTNELPQGEIGELAVKGPQVMQGYWHNSSETQKVFVKNGWLLTGDIASIDENGYVRILERKKDLILVSGFNVYPNEVEDVLARIPGVREVAVIGVPDNNSGEAVKAFIVKDAASLTQADVVSYAQENLTGYKVPKFIEFCPEIPKTNVGKILRRALRA
jgi:long-chain acyl-CoA synthetase